MATIDVTDPRARPHVPRTHHIPRPDPCASPVERGVPRAEFPVPRAVAPARQDRQEAAEADLLLARLADGDVDAWRSLVTRFRRLVHGAAFRARLTADEVEDVEQRVWLLLWRNAGGIRDARCLPGWIATTVRREAMAVVRARDMSRRGQLPDVADERPAPEEVVLRREQVTALHLAVAKLPPRERDIIRAVALDELSYDEASRRLVLPVGSIGPTRARALSRLRAALEPALAG